MSDPDSDCDTSTIPRPSLCCTCHDYSVIMMCDGRISLSPPIHTLWYVLSPCASARHQTLLLSPRLLTLIQVCHITYCYTESCVPPSVRCHHRYCAHTLILHARWTSPMLEYESKHVVMCDTFLMLPPCSLAHDQTFLVPLDRWPGMQ